MRHRQEYPRLFAKRRAHEGHSKRALPTLQLVADYQLDKLTPNGQLQPGQ